MSRAPVADFVDSFFTRTLFQADDDSLAVSVLDEELAPNIEIVINGTSFTKAAFTTLITTQFRTAFVSSIIEIKDLNIVTTNSFGSTGVVAQWTEYLTIGKEDRKELKQSATTIVRVEELHGKRVITGLWEAQTSD